MLVPCCTLPALHLLLSQLAGGCCCCCCYLSLQGLIVGQLLKHVYGCKVIGSAGSNDKVCCAPADTRATVCVLVGWGVDMAHLRQHLSQLQGAWTVVH
jgi:hypothetical protein